MREYFTTFYLDKERDIVINLYKTDEDELTYVQRELKQTRETDLAFFVELSGNSRPETPDELTIWQVAPAYIISELKNLNKIYIHHLL